eukprot:scaffold135173_cov10-Tisochrysis_lutea.AAC.1
MVSLPWRNLLNPSTPTCSLLFSGVSRISKERLFLSEPSVAVAAGALVERALNLEERFGVSGT